MVNDPNDEWNFAYVLPKLMPDEPTQLVIPSCLQMGWCESTLYFCAALETAWDIGETLASQPMEMLPAHPLEDYLVPLALWQRDISNEQLQDFLHLLEVHVDDFIQLVQMTDPIQLLYLSHTLLHGIYSVFSLPSVTGGTKKDPITLKKLCQGDGLWEANMKGTPKLGIQWHQMLHQTASREVQMHPDQIIDPTKMQQGTLYKDLECLLGKLRHTCIDMPASRGLLEPIDAALHSLKHWLLIQSNEALHAAFSDFSILL